MVEGVKFHYIDKRKVFILSGINFHKLVLPQKSETYVRHFYYPNLSFMYKLNGAAVKSLNRQTHLTIWRG